MRKWILALVLVFALFSPGCLSLIPSIITFEATPSIVKAGQSATLTWNINGASSVSIDPIGVVSSSGTQIVAPTTTTVYTVSANNFWGAVSRSIVLTVNPQPITINFEVNPATLMSGGNASLIWNVSGATSVSIDPGIGQVSPSGNRPVKPASTTTYTLTASNLGSIATGSVRLVVNPPIVATFTTSSVAIFAGQGSTLQWNVTGATSVSIDPQIGNVPASGSQIVNPYSTTTYTLTALSECCSVSKSVIVTVGSSYTYPYYYPYYPLYMPPFWSSP